MKSALIGAAFFMFANFIYQWFQTEPNMAIAIERSYFQGLIVLYLWFVLRNKVKA